MTALLIILVILAIIAFGFGFALKALFYVAAVLLLLAIIAFLYRTITGRSRT
jgi:hypothetical protein